ncbi:MAG: YfcZ/YiiS family protein [Enterobacteriaceae bacterium]|jgi:uncharacterized protein (TIGR00743 family)|nr:YfcZ/YiiS family protein [Enterobacteriaceae bacterium]
MANCKAEETSVCCCLDVGAIIDNTDCTASYQNVFANRAEAEETLKVLTEKARSVESDPCQISSRFQDVAEGVELTIDFVFSCQAETVIFQLGLR